MLPKTNLCVVSTQAIRISSRLVQLRWSRLSLELGKNPGLDGVGGRLPWFDQPATVGRIPDSHTLVQQVWFHWWKPKLGDHTISLKWWVHIHSSFYPHETWMTPHHTITPIGLQRFWSVVPLRATKLIKMQVLPTNSHENIQWYVFQWAVPILVTVCVYIYIIIYNYIWIYIYNYTINTLINSVTPDTREKCRIIRLLLGPTRRVFSESTTSTMSKRSTNIDMLVKQCRKPSIWVDGWYQP